MDGVEWMGLNGWDRMDGIRMDRNIAGTNECLVTSWSEK